MPNIFRAGLREFPPPADDNQTFVQVLLAEAKTSIERYCSARWAYLNPRAPVVKKVFDREVKEQDFTSNELPALFAWFTKIHDRKRLSFDIITRDFDTTLVWMPPPETTIKGALTESFWADLDLALQACITPVWGSTDNDGFNFGHNVSKKAGLYNLELGDGQRTEVRMEMPTKSYTRPIFMWEMVATEEMKPVFRDYPAPKTITNINTGDGLVLFETEAATETP